MKNTTNKKTQKKINDILEMVNQPAMSGKEFKEWRASWRSIIKDLKEGGIEVK